MQELLLDKRRGQAQALQAVDTQCKPCLAFCSECCFLTRMVFHEFNAH